uniref:Uncharacterized protein n=1 Tax=Castor canadensis TaxID=51338 RepID=A0A8C0XPY4_CASCN
QFPSSPPCILSCLNVWVVRGSGPPTCITTCGLEIFIFAYVIHPIQVANFVNAVYSLCPTSMNCWFQS